MSFFGSIFMLVSVVTAVFVPVLVGHGIASHNTTAILIGVGLIPVAGVLMTLASRSKATQAPESSGSGGH